ncbi:hypothetical protein ACE7GA_05250 [Roseomonas sp. CCTCC AB2023176]|uniref:hypothetical protein n=1 Tax=Roseomonas sp. CCTCC AB2023176 TaxID=3342640 RepID=UPI0035DE7A45
MIKRIAALVLVAGGLAACQDPLNTANRPDGTAGNPRGTEFSRVNDRVGDPLNLDNRPDCTAGNPPGTLVSRTIGTNDNHNCRSPAAARGATR